MTMELGEDGGLGGHHRHFPPPLLFGFNSCLSSTACFIFLSLPSLAPDFRLFPLIHSERSGLTRSRFLLALSRHASGLLAHQMQPLLVACISVVNVSAKRLFADAYFEEEKVNAQITTLSFQSQYPGVFEVSPLAQL